MTQANSSDAIGLALIDHEECGHDDGRPRWEIRYNFPGDTWFDTREEAAEELQKLYERDPFIALALEAEALLVALKLRLGDGKTADIVGDWRKRFRNCFGK